MKSGGFQVKSGGFHGEIRRISRVKSISKDQLPGMVSPMFSIVVCKDSNAILASGFVASGQSSAFHESMQNI